MLQIFKSISLRWWLSLLLLCSSSVLIASPLASKNLVIGVEDIEYYPYFDFTNNQPTVSKTILDKFAADNGYTLTYLALPIKQFSKWLHENDIDFKYPDNRRWHDPKSKEQLSEYYSNDIFHLRAGTIVLAENKHQPRAYYKNLGLITGFDPTLWKAYIADKQVNILDDNSIKVLVKHLVNGLVDGVDMDIAVANFYLQSLGIQRQLAYSEALPQEIFSHQLSTIKYPQIIQQFNQWLADNKAFVQTTLQNFKVPKEQPANLGAQ